MHTPDRIWFLALVLMHPATWIVGSIVTLLLLGLLVRSAWRMLRKAAKKGGA